ncbi:hypothetical protein N0V83_006861 [Neocucurbitaria cava]|uniref:Phosphoglycerate mutase-like protein n=1 Tax=Neocucurbitaria cava TaxID=798079 RepID=A0A9W8Y5T9_9PLEO|nr:hypothetical protein N0V83_006861 [Neocucurbitaria cava]
MFVRNVVTVMALAWLGSAQDQDDDTYHPHAAFAFIRTGDRTPIILPGVSVLTALGANQMLTLGQNFRTRYITGDSPNGLGTEHIAGLSQNTLDNDQILVKTLDKQYLMASAQAFMQGLYPPHALGNGTGDASGLLADGTTVNFPLDGYQYANVHSTSELDAQSINVAGSQNCPIAMKDAMEYFTTEAFMETRAVNQGFYGNLSADWFNGLLNANEIDYISALEIADYLTYQYTHNSTIYHLLANDSEYAGVYDKVRHLADQETWYLYGNTSTSAANNQAIPGKTLAAAILNQFELVITDQTYGGDLTDSSYPLTLYIGDHEPMISLLSLIMADHHDSNFRALPPFASSIVFELFSTGANASFPTNKEDLWVRFYFHNGTDFSANQMIAFPIFGNGPSRTDMPWAEFQNAFEGIQMETLTQWCRSCDSPSLFCWGAGETSNVSVVIPGSDGEKSKGNVSPVVAGVIGAVVTLAVAALLFALAMLLGGVRLHRRSGSKKSDLGGFKGSAKLASDPDLSLAKNGALPAGISFVGAGAGAAGAGADGKKGHERVGSWELRQKEFGQKEFGPRGGEEGDEDVSPRGSFDAIDAVAASKPVEPHERV